MRCVPSSAISVIPVWIVAALGALAVALAAPAAALSWLPVVLAGSILLTFAVQLAVSRKEGLVERIVASLGGAFTVLAFATLVLWFTVPL